MTTDDIGPHVVSAESSSALLFVPAGEESKTSKLATLDADGFILDLEDAVAQSRKAAAREHAAELIDRLGATQSLWVRVNPLDTEHHVLDVEAVIRPGLSGIILPKAESYDTVKDLDCRMSMLEEDRGIGEPIPVQPTIETVRGLAAVDGIAAAARRVSFLGIGSGDLSLDAGIDWPLDTVDHPLLTHARLQLVLASRRSGLTAPHDGSYPRHRDLDGLRAQAEFAKSIGFATKHAIHPAQVDEIRTVFAPSADEIDRARRIAHAFADAERDGRAAISIDDSLVDYPIWFRAQAVLRQAGVSLPS